VRRAAGAGVRRVSGEAVPYAATTMASAPIRPPRARTATAAAQGRYELFKTRTRFDSTAQHPEWLA